MFWSQAELILGRGEQETVLRQQANSLVCLQKKTQLSSASERNSFVDTLKMSWARPSFLVRGGVGEKHFSAGQQVWRWIESCRPAWQTSNLRASISSALAEQDSCVVAWTLCDKACCRKWSSLLPLPVPWLDWIIRPVHTGRGTPCNTRSKLWNTQQ